MASTRPVINFADPLSNSTLTQILGTTISCVASSSTYDEFRKCLVVPPSESETVVDAPSTGNVFDHPKSFRKHRK